MRFGGGAEQNIIKQITNCWAERQEGLGSLDFISNSLHFGLFFCFGLVFWQQEKKKKNGLCFSSCKTWSMITSLVPQEHCKEELREKGLFIAYIWKCIRNHPSPSPPPSVNLAGFTRALEGKCGYVLREVTIGKFWKLGREGQGQNSIDTL